MTKIKFLGASLEVFCFHFCLALASGRPWGTLGASLGLLETFFLRYGHRGAADPGVGCRRSRTSCNDKSKLQLKVVSCSYKSKVQLQE